MRCDECTGPTNEDCILCSYSVAVILSPITTFCECLMGYFPAPGTGECHSRS